MGPRLLSRGNAQDAMGDAEDARLQWGHGFSAVETATLLLLPSRYGVLQWGHGFSAVETARLVSSYIAAGYNARFERYAFPCLPNAHSKTLLSLNCCTQRTCDTRAVAVVLPPPDRSHALSKRQPPCGRARPPAECPKTRC